MMSIIACMYTYYQTIFVKSYLSEGYSFNFYQICILRIQNCSTNKKLLKTPLGIQRYVLVREIEMTS